MGIDYGDVRIGVSMSDAASILASPLATIVSSDALTELSSIVQEYSPIVIYIGLPLHLSGTESESSKKARELAIALRETIEPGISVRMLDERLSTKSAMGDLARAGQQFSKETIDQLAATAILEFAMNIERSSGSFAGHEI